MKGIPIMYDHKWKKVGIIVSVIGLLLMIAEKLKGFIILSKLNIVQHYILFEWVMLVGFALVMYSKEKQDDDRAKMIRLRSFQIAFLIMIAVLMGMGVTSSLSSDLVIHPGIFLMISAMGIIFYLLLFHIGLYFDFLWEYSDTGVLENLRNITINKWGIIAYLLAGAIILLLVSLSVF